VRLAIHCLDEAMLTTRAGSGAAKIKVRLG